MGRRRLRLMAVTASAALLLGTLAGCSGSNEPTDTATVVLDGVTYTAQGRTRCVTLPDDTLTIQSEAPSGIFSRAPGMVWVVLKRHPRWSVDRLSFRFNDVSGFTDHSDELWATKTDNTYTVNGRVPSDHGQLAWRQFQLTVTCPYVQNLPQSARPM
jgi:hypothetical protein